MATTNLQPLVDAFAVAYWFPNSKRKTISRDQTGREIPVGSYSAKRSRGRELGAMLPFTRGRSGRAPAHSIEILINP